jgi:hypothetical protein
MAEEKEKEETHVSSDNLFQECVSFWGCSIVAPTTTNLRILARKGLLSDETDAERILSLPFTLDVMMEIFLKNQDTMLKHFADDNGIPFHIETVGLYQKHSKNAKNVQLVIFEDERSEEELVYGIMVNPILKRIYLTFRGSVTKRDYEADFNVRMKTMKDYRGKKILLQRGFSDYLFGSDDDQASATKHGGKYDVDGLSPFCKYDEIVQTLLSSAEEYPDCELCVTGHSLGGSLSLLCSYRLATEEKLKGKFRGPVRSFGFGSLLVGDLNFLRSFQSLERDGMVKSLVIMNEGDVIPLLPFSSGFRFYRGVGNRLILSKRGRKPIIYRPPEPWPCCKYDWISVPGFIVPRFVYILCCHRRFWENHTVKTTQECMIASKDFLTKMSLDQVYAMKRSISL